MYAILGVPPKMKIQRRKMSAMASFYRTIIAEVRSLWNWRRENSDLFIVLSGIAFYLFLGFGLHFGWLRPRVRWLYIAFGVALPGISMLISIIKLGWIDRLLGTNWAARWWAWEGRCELKLGQRAEAARCFRKAQQLMEAPLEPFRPLAKVACALRVTKLLTQVGMLLSIAGASQSKGKRFALWCLAYTAALCRQAGNLQGEIEALGYIIPNVSPDLSYQIELRRHFLKRLMELEEVKKIVLEAQKALQTPKAAQFLERLLRNLRRLPVRDRKCELLILTALSYIYARRSNPMAWEYTRQAGQVLKEILYVEPSPFTAGQRILIDSYQLDTLARPLQSLAGSLPDELSWVLWLLLAICYADERQFEKASMFCERAIQGVERARITRADPEQRLRFMTEDKMLVYDFMLKLLLKTGGTS
jgi:tetratricopeptide (TPR) repeat protein